MTPQKRFYARTQRRAQTSQAIRSLTQAACVAGGGIMAIVILRLLGALQ